jgi:hypothetical protein
VAKAEAEAAAAGKGEWIADEAGRTFAPYAGRGHVQKPSHHTFSASSPLPQILVPSPTDRRFELALTPRIARAVGLFALGVAFVRSDLSAALIPAF